MRETGRAHLLVYAVAAVLLALAAVRLLDRGDDQRAPAIAVQGGPPAAEPKPGDERLFVHVAGAVRRPGLYRVASPARVADALAEAGGPTRAAELTAINLAAPLQDGQQVLVPRRAARPAPMSQPGGASGAAPSSRAPPSGGLGSNELAQSRSSASASAAAAPGVAGAGAISLATATQTELEGLDGIGPTLAARIIEYRDAHGGFRSVDELQEVDGIGEKRFSALRQAVRP